MYNTVSLAKLYYMCCCFYLLISQLLYSQIARVIDMAIHNATM